ncbi:Phosphatidylinositol-4-phosphate 5-kinase [Allomyces javanicus]|nr:Phosphatidylinositol-4-phosphate 5-kinase [Allomyces javanicus]
MTPPPPPPVSTDTMHAAAPVPPPTAAVAPSSVPPLKAAAPPTAAPSKLSLITTPLAANGTTPLTESPESIAGSSPTKPIVATTPPSPTAPNAPPTRQRSASDAPVVAAAGALRTSGGGGAPRSRRGTADGSPGPHPIVAGSSGRSSVVSFGPMASTGLAGSVSVATAGPGPARSSSATAAAAGSSPVVAAAAAKVRRHTVTAQDAAGIATAASSIVAAHGGGEAPQVSNMPRRSMSRKMSTRFGHRIDQNHEKYAFIFFMLTGIRLSVSRCETKPDRDLLPDDFTAQHKLTSDATGAELDPSQRYDFKFKDYCPMAFRKIRTAFGLRGADYLSSLTGKYILSELFSPGKSGASLFFSHDYRYIIKSIHHAEHKRLLKMLPQYVDYVTKHPNTLLARYYGLHRVKMPSQKPVHFVVMANVFPPHYDMHMTFDLKGSTVGREIPPDELERKGKRAVLKDLNWLNMDRKLMLGPDKAKQFATQLEQDVLFLMDRKIMDYSLLIGIHDLSRSGGGGNAASPTTPAAATAAPASASIVSAPPAHLQVLEPNRTMTLARDPSTPRAETVRRALHQPEITKIDTVAALHVAASANADRTRSVFFADHGGFQATDANNQPGPELYFMSVIDILTPYNAAKRVEHAFKAVTQDRHQISAVPPDEYGKRFVRFMTSLVWTPPAGHFAAFAAAAGGNGTGGPQARPGSPASAPAAVPSAPTGGAGGTVGTAGSHFVPAVPRDAPIGEEAEASGSTPEVGGGGAAQPLADATGPAADVVPRTMAGATSYSAADGGAARMGADGLASMAPDASPRAVGVADQAEAGTR